MREQSESQGQGGEPLRSVPSVYRPELQDGEKPQEKALGKADLARAVGKALRDSRGDIVLASRQMNMSVAKFAEAIKMSRQFRKLARELKRHQENAHGQHVLRGTIEQIEEDVRRKAILYKHEAMDVLLEIASQPLTENGYNNQIKLHAAMKLVDLPGVKIETHLSDHLAETLKILNDDFNRNAPRLRVIRETVRETVEVASEPRGHTIDVTAQIEE